MTCSWCDIEGIRNTVRDLCSSIDFSRWSFTLLHWVLQKIIGRIVVFFMFATMISLGIFFVMIVAPSESVHQPWWCFFPFVSLIIYFEVNVLYHYYKVCTVLPGYPPKSLKPPLCRHCNNHKPEGVFHCPVCNKCILKMDHHCISINQCVGAKNHRHFFLFIASIFFGSIVLLLGGSSTFYYNYWVPNTKHSFCQSKFGFLPWFDWVCSEGNGAVQAHVFSVFLLCALVAPLVGILVYFNFAIISSGRSCYEMAQDEGIKTYLKVLCCPTCTPNFEENWKRFLGLRGSRTFVKHVLFPSGHQSYYDDEEERYKHDELTHIVIE